MYIPMYICQCVQLSRVSVTAAPIMHSETLSILQLMCFGGMAHNPDKHV